MSQKQIFLDVETIKTFDQVGGYYPEKLEVSFVGVIERDGFPEEKDVREVRHEFFQDQLPLLWPLLERADIIIGFNLIGFDLPALRPYYNGDIHKLPALDLLEVIKNKCGHRVSLDAVATQTIGSKKIGNGLDAIKYYANGQLKELAMYCMKDVEITRDVYDFGRRYQKVKFLNKWNNLIELDIDFDYHPVDFAGVQMTLV